MATIYLTTASISPWSVPIDWNPASNTVECVGGGGGAAVSIAVQQYGAGGGGGAYAAISNLMLTPGATVQFQVGVGGSPGLSGTNGGNGGDTWFSGTTLVASFVAAKGGGGGQYGGSPSYTAMGGQGGLASSGVGTTRYSGGSGAPVSGSANDGGGGGAAGPNGNGGNGGLGEHDGMTDGGGGGGAGGGGNGASFAGGNGGAGGAGSHGSGSGGNGGNANGASNATSGGNGTEWEGSHGSGGGGGSASGGSARGGNGGLYGGGGGSSWAAGYGNGAEGLIVITYAPQPIITADAPVTIESCPSQCANSSLRLEAIADQRCSSTAPVEMPSRIRSDPAFRLEALGSRVTGLIGLAESQASYRILCDTIFEALAGGALIFNARFLAESLATRLHPMPPLIENVAACFGDWGPTTEIIGLQQPETKFRSETIALQRADISSASLETTARTCVASSNLAESITGQPGNCAMPTENLGAATLTRDQLLAFEAMGRAQNDSFSPFEMLVCSQAQLSLPDEIIGQVGNIIVDSPWPIEAGCEIGADAPLADECPLSTGAITIAANESWFTPLLQIQMGRLLKSPGRVRRLARWER